MRHHPSHRAQLPAFRRTLRAFVAGGALAALTLGAALAGPLADAAPSAVHAAASTIDDVTVVTGDGTVTAAWTAVPGATLYTVRVATAKSLAHARVLTTTATTAGVAHLVDGRTYWIGVTATIPATGTTTTATASPAPTPTPTSATTTVSSRPVAAVPAAGVPVRIGPVRVVSGPAENQVTVSWTGGSTQTKVGIVAGSNVLVNQRSFHSAWYPATTHSITITVPKQYRAFIGAGTGNPVWIRVAQSNSTSTAFGASYDAARKYRPSPIGEWAFAKAIVPAAATTKLRVAELNTQSVGSSTKFSVSDRWAARAPRVAAYIDSAKADLLLTAELATNTIVNCRNTLKSPYRCAHDSQVADLAKRLTGLTLADCDTYARVMDEMRAFGGRWNAKVTDGAHVFYNPASLTLVGHGYFSPALSPSQSFANVTGLGVSHWTGTGAVGADRWLSWAEFETKDGTHRRFYAVAAHFPVGDAQAVVDARAEESRKVVAAIDRLAGDLPVVFGGDMNSDAVRSPKAAHTAFMLDGWFDAGAVSNPALRTGMRVSTANGAGQVGGGDPGYAARPRWFPYPTSRIDYIILRNSPYTYRYENVLHLNSAGEFVRSLQGTDHNMQLATIGIADPPSAR